MSVIEHESKSSLIHREANYRPGRSWRTWLIGRPLATADAPHQAIGKFVGLAVFSSDAMSSVAYGPQELMLVLAAAGAAGLNYAVPLAIGIVVLLTILTLSYEQTIHAYPGGGGAYIVARDNLGELPAQIAGAALLTDYILTVAVSISSGVAQITSAFPHLYAYRVEIAVAMVVLIMTVNLRGVKESGAIFAAPTYFFLGMAFLTVIVGAGALPDRQPGDGGEPTGTGAGARCAGTDPLPALASLCQRHDFAYRRGGDLQRHPCVPRTQEPQCRHHPDLDVVHPGLAAAGDHVPGASDRRRAFGRRRDCHLTIGPHGVRQSRGDLPGHDRVHDPHPDHGSQHVVRRLSPPGRACRGRRFLTQAVDLQGQPAGLLARHYGPGAASHRC